MIGGKRTQKTGLGTMLPCLTTLEQVHLSFLPYSAQSLYTVWFRPFLNEMGEGVFEWRFVTKNMDNRIDKPDRTAIEMMMRQLESRNLIEIRTTNIPWSFKIRCPLAMDYSFE